MSIEIVVTAIITFLAGVGIGFFAGRASMAKTAEHGAIVEAELKRAQREVGEYRHQVKNHFEQTADLVAELTHSYRDMTQNYKKVYEHLAKGAQTLADGDADMMIAASTIEKLIYEADEDTHVARIGNDTRSKTAARKPVSKPAGSGRRKKTVDVTAGDGAARRTEEKSAARQGKDAAKKPEKNGEKIERKRKQAEPERPKQPAGSSVSPAKTDADANKGGQQPDGKRAEKK